MSDLFDVQDEITQTICAQLQPTLTLSEIRHQERQGNLEAWALYQKGWASWSFSFTSEAAVEALESLKLALELEPDYAIVHAAVCVVLANRVTSGWTNDPARDFGEAHEHLQRALALSSDNLCMANS